MFMLVRYEYMNAFLIIVITGFIIDVFVYLARQVKKTGKWGMDYSRMATFLIGGMFLMSYFTYIFRGYIEVSMFVILWLLLPCYSLLRSLARSP